MEIREGKLLAILQPELFKALSDPVRISIVANLAASGEDSNTVSDVSTCCGVDFSGVSRHLKILRDANVVTRIKKGRKVFYRLNTESLSARFRDIVDSLTDCDSTKI